MALTGTSVARPSQRDGQADTNALERLDHDTAVPDNERHRFRSSQTHASSPVTFRARQRQQPVTSLVSQCDNATLRRAATSAAGPR
jgi:hypothetical protein